MKFCKDGHITIPKKLRDLLGLKPDSIVNAVLTREGLLLVPEDTQRKELASWLQAERETEDAELRSHEIQKAFHDA